MTENKRFIPIFDGFDKRVVGAKDNGKIISFMDMFDLLNELNDENQRWEDLSVEDRTQIERLEEENEQLKSVVKEVIELLSEEVDLFSDKATEHDINAHMKNLRTIYGHFDIELPKLPPVKAKDEEAIQTTYFDLPTRQQIGMAVEIAGIRVGSLILFMASSGTGRTECANMTIKDFTDACREYHNSETLPEILDELYGCIEPIVPTFYLFRQKTSKKYYTFCTPETANAIVEWLKLRLKMCEEHDEELQFTDSLWGLTTRQITYHLSNINDELGFGYKGPYRFLRPHSLRKFHASNIGLSEDNIDLLQGRSRDAVHETYIKTNPVEFKKVYMNVMDNVTIGKIGQKDIIHEDFTINLNLNFYGAEYGINI